MKSGTSPRVGAIDAVASGLNLAARRPWLLALPALIDLTLWLAPRLAIGDLLGRLAVVWEALLRTAYTPAQMSSLGDVLALAKETLAQIGRETNLAHALAGGWLALPSAIASPQPGRLMLISDAVLAPLGFSLPLKQIAAPVWQVTAQVGNFWVVALIVVGLWLLGQALTAIYLRWMALVAVEARRSSAPKANEAQAAAEGPSEPLPLRPLIARFVALGLLLGLTVFALRLPLAAVTTFAMMTGSTGVGIVFMLSGGLTLWLTLWFLVSVFFAAEEILLERQSLWAGLWQSLALTRRSSFRALGFVILINLLLLGFRAVWGLVGQTTLGVIAAIIGNAYLATGLVLAAFSYYEGLRLEAKAAREKKGS